MKRVRILARLKETCAETIVETLVAVLICGMSAAIVMAGLGTSSALNIDAKKLAKQEMQESRWAAEHTGYLSEGAQPTGTVTFSDKKSGRSESFSGDEVKVYGGELIVSYEVLPE